VVVLILLHFYSVIFISLIIIPPFIIIVIIFQVSLILRLHNSCEMVLIFLIKIVFKVLRKFLLNNFVIGNLFISQFCTPLLLDIQISMLVYLSSIVFLSLSIINEISDLSLFFHKLKSLL
jgi:hypothetical protein